MISEHINNTDEELAVLKLVVEKLATQEVPVTKERILTFCNLRFGLNREYCSDLIKEAERNEMVIFVKAKNSYELVTDMKNGKTKSPMVNDIQDTSFRALCLSPASSNESLLCFNSVTKFLGACFSKNQD